MLEEDEIANYTGGMRIFIGDPAIEATGTLMITSRRVVWLPSNGQQRVQGFSLFYQAIAMHAVSRDVSDFPHPCLYVQLDAEQNISEVSDALRQGGGPAVKRQRQAGEAGEAPAEGEEAEDEVEPVDYQEMRLVPAAPSDAALDAMFKAMSEGAALNPDPDDGEGGDDDGFFADEDELLAGVSAQQLSMLERYENMLAAPAEAADNDGRFDDAEEEEADEDNETGQAR